MLRTLLLARGTRLLKSCHSSSFARFKNTLAQPAVDNDTPEQQALQAEDDRSLKARRDKFPKLLNVSTDICVQRPTRKSFKRPGFAKDLLQNLEDFPHALLLTRVGQFYESYFDQAIEISDLLKIRLTSKSMEGTKYPMCGFPIAQMDKFMEKLVREHNRFVAICEEDKRFDSNGNLLKIVRKVVRVVTPGTLVDEAFIEKQKHNFLLAVDLRDVESEEVELAWVDTSTGELFTQGSTISNRSLEEDLARIAPAEIVLPRSLEEHRQHPILRMVQELEGSPRCSFTYSTSSVESQKAHPADGGESQAFSAIPLLSAYISETLLDHQPDLTHPLRVRPTNSMRIDRVSLKALEIKQNNDGGRSGTLISVLDRTVTAAGMRLLSDRITSPSKSVSEIQARQSLVEYFLENTFTRESMIHLLHQLDDEARLLQKMSIGRPTAEDLLTMAKAIRVQITIKELLEKVIEDARAQGFESANAQFVEELVKDIQPHGQLADRIEAAVDIKALEAQKVRDYATELNSTSPTPESVDDAEEEGVDIWDIASNIGKSKKREKKDSQADPIPDCDSTTLKSEATRRSAKAPPEPITWGKTETTVLQPDSSPILTRIYDDIRKVQTRAQRLHKELVKQMETVSSEILLRVLPRFGPIIRIGWKKTHPPAMREALAAMDAKGTITLVRKATSARYFAHSHWTKLNSEMQGLLVQLKEAEAFAVKQLCGLILEQWHSLRRNAAVTAELDVAASFAKAAKDLNLSRPVFNEGVLLDIKDGRHPVAQHELSKLGRQFIANGTTLNENCKLQIITGPNMGGKSTILRQVGLIAIMAQAGSFVPAAYANIGIVDQIFARIRYSDNIARGRSSFRVEMDDATYILHNATEKSLVLLDEFGRGTTADYAVCIAEATIYELVSKIGARSLFATHLHDIYDILHADDAPRKDLRDKIAFFCTHLEDRHKENHTDMTATGLNYQYKLVPGINRNAEAFAVAYLSGYPSHLLERAEHVYTNRLSVK